MHGERSLEQEPERDNNREKNWVRVRERGREWHKYDIVNSLMHTNIRWSTSTVTELHLVYACAFLCMRLTERLGCCIVYIQSHCFLFAHNLASFFFLLFILQCFLTLDRFQLLFSFFLSLSLCVYVAPLLYPFHCHHFIYSKILAP